MQEDCEGTHQAVTTRLEFPLGQRAEGARGSLNMSQRPEAVGPVGGLRSSHKPKLSAA